MAFSTGALVLNETGLEYRVSLKMHFFRDSGLQVFAPRHSAPAMSNKVLPASMQNLYSVHPWTLAPSSSPH